MIALKLKIEKIKIKLKITTFIFNTLIYNSNLTNSLMIIIVTV